MTDCVYMISINSIIITTILIVTIAIMIIIAIDTNGIDIFGHLGELRKSWSYVYMTFINVIIESKNVIP